MSVLVRHPVPREPGDELKNVSRLFLRLPDPPAPSGRIMSSLAAGGGLAASGGIAGPSGGLAG